MHVLQLRNVVGHGNTRQRIQVSVSHERKHWWLCVMCYRMYIIVGLGRTVFVADIMLIIIIRHCHIATDKSGLANLRLLCTVYLHVETFPIKLDFSSFCLLQTCTVTRENGVQTCPLAHFMKYHHIVQLQPNLKILFA